MYRQLGSTVRLMALGGLVVSGEQAWAGNPRPPPTASRPAQNTTPASRQATAPRGTVLVAVDLRGTTRWYSFDRATRKLTPVAQPSRGASSTTSFQSLKEIERQLRDSSPVEAVAPEGHHPHPPGPPGGDGPFDRQEVEVLKAELTHQLAVPNLGTVEVRIQVPAASAR